MLEKIERFIAEKGVTRGPSFFTDELKKLNTEKEKQYRDMTPEQRRAYNKKMYSIGVRQGIARWKKMKRDRHKHWRGYGI